MPQRTNYVYRSLHDAFQGPRPSLVNVYAIVTEWTMPKPTKGSDYHVILKVIDPSVSALTTEQNNSYTDISINFFASRELLPAPRKVGDIIRLHRLSVNNYQGRTQFVAKIGMLGGGRGAGGFSRCHYCLFDGPGEGITNDPYFTSSVTHSFEPSVDVPLISNLREHWTEIGKETPFPILTRHVYITRA